MAFLAAALFATHPLATQAVTYIVQRLASLAALFSLLAVVLFLVWRLGRERREVAPGATADGVLPARRSPRWRYVPLYAGVLLSATLAMMTKESAFTLPLLIALVDVLLFPPRPWRDRLFLLPIAATAMVIPLTFLSYVPLRADSLAGAARVQTPIARLDYLFTQAPVVLEYLRLLVWPAGQNLDHDIPLARGLLEPRVFLSALVLLALCALALALLGFTRWPVDAERVPALGTEQPRSSPGHALDPAFRLVSLGVVWFFVALTVESSLIPIVDVMYEHRAYLPSVGILVAAAAGAGLAYHRLSSRDPFRFLVASGVVLALVLGVATFSRNRVWKGELTLWADAAAKSPGKVRPHANLGTALATAGRLNEALPEFQRAIELDPSFTYARAQLAAALLALGRPTEAEPQLREALRQPPKDPEVLFNLAVLLLGREERTRLGRSWSDSLRWRRLPTEEPVSWPRGRCKGKPERVRAGPRPGRRRDEARLLLGPPLHRGETAGGGRPHRLRRRAVANRVARRSRARTAPRKRPRRV